MLGHDLEVLALKAIANGQTAPDLIKEKDLSKEGKAVFRALVGMSDKGAEPPFSTTAVRASMVSVQGVTDPVSMDLLDRMDKAGDGHEAASVLDMFLSKRDIVDLINTANEQLLSGKMDLATLAATAEEKLRAPTDLLPLSEHITGDATMETGAHIATLPALSEATGGLLRFWVVGGEPGLGKSTLAMQIALEAAKEMPVYYVDYENVIQDIDARLTSIYGSVERAKEATQRIFYRESIANMARDLTVIKPPALIVVDSLQNLPVSVKESRTALGQWINRFKDLTKKGYHVLAVSEIPRSEYDENSRDKKGNLPDPGMGGFKETGAIEYGAHVGIQLRLDKVAGSVKLFIVKNRNRAKRGLICYLNRDPNKAWWFTEESATHGRVKTNDVRGGGGPPPWDKESAPSLPLPNGLEPGRTGLRTSGLTGPGWAGDKGKGG